MRPVFLPLAAFCLLFPSLAWTAEIYVPAVVPQGQETANPYNLTGMISTHDSYGSGAVAAHPSVVVSCAHVIFSMDYMAWTSGAEWFAAWNTGSAPIGGTGDLLSGYYYWAGYRAAVQATERAFASGRSPLAAEAREFNLDFVAYFHHGKELAAGNFAGVVADGVPWMTNASIDKTITGYPMGRYASGDPSEFRMHVTGPFKGSLTPELKSAKRYVTAYNLAETGSGNSGGPVWVDQSDGTKALAAVLVSGQEQPESKDSMVGVHAVSPDGWRLINSALSAAGSGSPTERSFDFNGGEIPDYSTLKRSVRVSGLPKTAVGVTLDLKIQHPFKSDITVEVRAPGRKTAFAYDGQYDEEPGQTIEFSAEKLSYLYGVNPNGTWTIVVRDWEPQDVGTLVSAKLTISAR